MFKKIEKYIFDNYMKLINEENRSIHDFSKLLNLKGFNCFYCLYCIISFQEILHESKYVFGKIT
jgi:hypothetical protein